MTRKLSIGLLVLISWAFFALLGIAWGTWNTMTSVVPMVEERTIRKVNTCLDEARIKRYRFRTGDDGSVHLMTGR